MIITRINLLENGAVEKENSCWNLIDKNGSEWQPKPSDNDNGWYAGELYNNDFLVYERI